ncbi:MAG TPA: PSD1 and planctomycete cytochrome C domain-containing protein, partial [Roseimicrobium sp.]|nr:PSD1 and planctomycete cytochrome C domain-containing protein [Roseimicrobium sp.]
KAHCFHCHGEGEKLKGDLDVRLAHFLTKGGESGPALIPGKPEKSLLVQQVQSDEMPKGEKKLTTAEKDVLKRWVASGAKTARPEPAELGKGPVFTEEEKQFWAFQPIQNPPVPKVRKKELVRNPIDAFLLQKLSDKNLGYAPPADRTTLIRRVTFDLLGLPPTPEEIDQFVKDTSPDAYQKLIDRLLASPAYGERWGRHWLDLAGYADSNGFTEADAPRAHAWRYRDYVIRSINADKPLSEFIREQLAGDEIAGPVQKELTTRQIELLTATGFLRMAPDGTDESLPDANLARNQVIADTVKVVSSSILGMTVACAQCHDHRYDPITIDDYYRMRAVFDPAFDWKNWRGPGRRLVSLYTEADRQKAREVEAEAVKIDQARKVKEDAFIQATFDKEVAKLPEELREPARVARTTAAAKRDDAQKKLMKEYPSLNVSSGSLYLYDKKAADELAKMSEEATKIRAGKPVENFVMAATEIPGKIPDSFVFNRGDHDQPKQRVEPGEFLILASLNPPAIPAKPATNSPTSGRRLTYANWLTSGNHPLVARVLVNRVWSEHFGRGIVSSVGDFGRLGQRPTHPELLDWLATDFMSHGWSLKQLHRTILSSTAYQRSSARDPKKERVDPDNALLGRMNIRRLDSETLRDAMLSVSGKLNPAQFGPPVPIARHPSGRIVTGKEKLNTNREPIDVLSVGDDEYRRSVYVEVRRTRPLTLLETFDAPTMTPNCEARSVTTVAPQSLLLMNDVFVVAQSREMAARLEKEAGKDTTAQVNRAWKLLHGAAPIPVELERSLTFLREQTEYFKGNPVKPKKGDTAPAPGPEFHALASYCQVLLGSNRFLYID